MSLIEAYDVKARKKVSLEHPETYQMKNGTWAIKGKSSETGITVYKIVGTKKPEISPSPLQYFKKIFHRN
ncbi:MAG TPA: hypothetical protein VD828_00220 [Candidatus Nitrosotenuis sp.]|nr:hypothetical protein [Candidatus Nitrosotenuis sp.]